MSRNTSSRLFMALLLSLSVLPIIALAQSQDSQAQSVADAARRAREQKKNAVKPTKVVTDDDIPARPPQPEVQQAAASGTQTSGSAAPAATSADTTAPAPSNSQPAAEAGKDATAKPTDDPGLAQLKDQIAQAQKEVDLAKREQSLAQDTYYSNPDYIRDKAGKAKIDGLQQQVADKQQALDALKTQLANYKPSAPPKQ